MNRPDSLAKVRDNLCQMAADVMNDGKRAPYVHEGANALGKVIGATKVYLEYCQIAGRKPDLAWQKFIEGT